MPSLFHVESGLDVDLSQLHFLLNREDVVDHFLVVFNHDGFECNLIRSMWQAMYIG